MYLFQRGGPKCICCSDMCNAFSEVRPKYILQKVTISVYHLRSVLMQFICFQQSRNEHLSTGRYSCNKTKTIVFGEGTQ